MMPEPDPVEPDAEAAERPVGLPQAQAVAEVRRWRAGAESGPAASLLPEEVAVAFTYDRASHAVMMATPRDLEDFACGFSLTEGIIERREQLAGLEVVPRPAGIELRMELAEDRLDALLRRRRHMAGPVGCGLCGLESLEAVLRPLPPVPREGGIGASAVLAALEALSAGQALHQATRAVHAAGFWSPAAGLVAVREDVGRHNALDKLAGALLRQGVRAADGAVVLTSRVSVEMVQKAAIMGAPVLIAVSAPTALAVRSAEQCGMTLVARARNDGFDVHSHSRRVTTS
ncbi:formate dehydrogenase accessory sulfurtransferase FdhD [Teichococcus vastitatis]|uniref:Sulfur carrier protein FdhD n=1 Tax=Teichococcus vastitatis TaxID=2307076 RepID=A0ABS9WBT4_9PROT|nr:formate dehydrogenase accessory sulfurtransferase FdhD [Pseudoroseomonas vastitatis]MCI0756769.1 formate dehydrogenase accessory sulfurtransferase FdhD [Pseudoroseomonas vastitatis]